jgi:type IV pilus assembly protein PilM
MLGFVQNFFAPKANPIGVDFGSDCLRLAQVQEIDGDFHLVAAACADVPPHVRHDPESRLTFFAENIRELMMQAPFHGRHAILALPASMMHIQHLRLSRMDEETLKKTIPWETRGKLPIDPSHALLRHLVAGEIYHEQEPRMEVIVMAAARDWINQFLAAAARARLDVIGMNVEPAALVDCFSHVYRRKTDRECTQCFVDIGASATRAVIARNGHILFARNIHIGGDHLTRLVAESLKIGFDDAKTLRIKLAASEGAAGAKSTVPAQTAEEAMPLLGAGLSSERRRAVDAAAPTASTAVIERDEDPAEEMAAPVLREQVGQVEHACCESLKRLAAELDLCRRYHEATFPLAPVDRLVFVGGEARQRSFCQNVARELGLAAQLGDPMCRMSRISDVGIESGIDRRLPQPAWTVAIGLSMGTKSPDKDS